MAGSAVVGILKALLTCDTAEFTKAMSGASTEVAELGKKLQNDLEPRQRAINNLVKEFLGGGEIRRAQEMAEAVTQMGGAAKLAEQDQLRVNKAVSEALGHYRALGAEAPKNLLDLEQATRRLPEPLDQTNASLDKIWGGLKSAAGLIGVTFTVGAVVNFATKVFDAASAVHDNAVALGFSAEAFQRNKFAAEQSGGSVEAFTRAANKLNDQLGEGSKSTVASLKAAGLAFDEIRAKKPEDAWIAVSDAVGKIADPMERARVAQDLFGKGALELLPGMIEGYAKLGENATVMSNETIDALEKAQDAWAELGNKVVTVTGQVIGAVLTLKDRQKAYFTEQVADLAALTAAERERAIAHLAMAQSLLHNTSVASEHQKILDLLNISQLDVVASTDAHVKASQAGTKSTKEQTEEQKKAVTAATAVAEALKKAAEKQDEYNKKIRAGADILTGQAVARKMKELADEVKAAGGASHVTAYEAERLGKQLLEMEKQGARVPPVLEEFARKQAALNSALALGSKIMGPNDLQAALKGYTVKLEGIPPVMDKILPAGNDVIGMLQRLGIATVELKPPPEAPWTEWRIAAVDAGLWIEDSIGAGFARMVGHASHFKSEMKNIWEDIKNVVIGYFADIASTFIHDLLDGMLGALMGRKGAFGAAFSNLIPSGLFGGGAGAGGVAGGVAAIPGGAYGGGAGAAAGSGGGALAGILSGIAVVAAIIARPGYWGEQSGSEQARQLHQKFLDEAAYLGLTPEEYADRGGVDESLGTDFGNFARGGYIPATPGGQMIRVAEGGEGEYVIPASRMGGGIGGDRTVNLAMTIQGIDGASIDRVVRSPRFKQAVYRAVTDDQQFSNRLGSALGVG